MLYQMKATILLLTSTSKYVHVRSCLDYSGSHFVPNIRKLDLLQDIRTLADVLPHETGELDHMPTGRRIQSK